MRRYSSLFSFIPVLFTLFFLAGCDSTDTQPVSSTGVGKATATVHVQADGLTVEQGNIAKRLALENAPGSIKHLYVFSAYSGQCMIYSTVKGKVTSSGKRLTPTTVSPGRAGDTTYETGFRVAIGGRDHYTAEVLQDDGTYGSSSEYLFWFDSRGIYHQHYISGGTVVHVSDQPLAVKSITLNFESIGQ